MTTPTPATDASSPRAPYGALVDPSRQHAVLDIAHWESVFPIATERRELYQVYTPEHFAKMEQARRLAQSHGSLGPSVPADFFAWSTDYHPERSWLTQLGGRPWRDKDKPWPKDRDGIPLHFLGQLCFTDSKDILPCELPGDVALIFGRWQDGWAFCLEDGVLEWSSRSLTNYCPRHFAGWTVELPFCYQGVIHRSIQYTDLTIAEPSFRSAGWKDGGWRTYSVQATSIGTYAGLPQGWPFSPNDGNMLIGVLSSFYCGGQWPLCNVPDTAKVLQSDGTVHPYTGIGSGCSFGVHDAGCIWVYRDKHGHFHLDEAC